MKTCRHARMSLWLLLAVALGLMPGDSAGDPPRISDNTAATGVVLAAVAKGGHADWFGTVVEVLVDKGKDPIKEGLQQWHSTGSADALRAAAGNQAYRVYVAQELEKATNAMGWLALAMEVGDHAANERYGEVGWTVGLATLKQLGGAKLVAAKVSTLPLSTLIMSIQIYRQSVAAVRQEVAGAAAENMLGRLAILRNRERQTGDPTDPFPLTRENIDKVWLLIIRDARFREGFQAYATQVLNADWPALTPEHYAVMPIADPDSPTQWRPLHSHADITQMDDVAVQLRTLITLAITEINRQAKVEETRMVAVKAIREIEGFFQREGAGMEQGLRQLDLALWGLPEVLGFAETCGEAVDKAIADKDYYALLEIRHQIVRHFREVLRWIPDFPPFGSVKTQPAKRMTDAFFKAGNALGILKKDMEAQAAAPPTPPLTAPAPPTATEIFQKYFAPAISEDFDWGGTGGPDAARSVFARHLESRGFRAPCDRAHIIGPPWEPLAENVRTAWIQENYEVACGGAHAVGTPVPRGAWENTRGGYRQRLRERVPSIASDLEREFQEEHRAKLAAIPRPPRCPDARFLWRRDCYYRRVATKCGICKPRWEAYERRRAPVIAEYLAKLRALKGRVERIETPLGDSGEAWSVTYRRVETGAIDMAYAAIENRVLLVEAEHLETLDWMNAAYEAYQAWVSKLYQEASLIARQLGGTVGRAIGGWEHFDPGPDLGFGALEWPLSGVGEIEPPSGHWWGQPESNPAGLISRLEELAEARFRNARWLRNRHGDRLAWKLTRFEQVEAAISRWDNAIAYAEPHLADIRTWVHPPFLAHETRIREARARAPQLVRRERGEIELFLRRRDQAAYEFESDGYYLRQMARYWREFFAVVDQYQLYGQRWAYSQEQGRHVRQGWGINLFHNPGQHGIHAHVIHAPHRQYVTPALRTRIAGELQTAWAPLEKPVQKHTPWAREAIQEFLRQVAGLDTFSEENILLPFSSAPITAGRLDQVQRAMAGLQPGSADFHQVYRDQVLSALPGKGGSGGSRYWWQLGKQLRSPGDLVYATPLGERYLALRGQLEKLMEQQRQLEADASLAQLRAQLTAGLATLQAAISNAEDLLRQVEAVDRNDREALRTLLAAVRQAGPALRTAWIGVTQFPRLPEDDPLRTQIERLETPVQSLTRVRLPEAERSLAQWLEAALQQTTAAVQAFYDTFVQNYRRRNARTVVAMLSDDWSAGDGTTLADLEETLDNSFRVFDEVSCTISGLTVTPQDGGARAVYEIAITGRIHRNRIRHDETSQVVEDLRIEDGRVRIVRTHSGRFWSTR